MLFLINLSYNPVPCHPVWVICSQTVLSFTLYLAREGMAGVWWLAVHSPPNLDTEKT